ncbi:MAG TPA: substrate-binding domain-containing protein [Trebonia sp.]|nr:substrate-binding domain-containing protein [Trebonia sp.]
MRLLPVLIPLVAAFTGMIGAILSALGFARPGRMPRPRRMVNYRVHYDDSLGNTHPDMKGVGELVVRRQGQDVPDASLAMIRISNEGGLDVGEEHWAMPINFTFDGRDVVGVEVSDTAGQVTVYPNLVPHQVAIVIFSVVVNHATKIYSLTRAELVGIWTGKYTNWRQLGGVNLPIDIVSRTTDSGTRATFDRKILGMRTEIQQSSESCTSPDLIPGSR